MNQSKIIQMPIPDPVHAAVHNPAPTFMDVMAFERLSLHGAQAYIEQLLNTSPSQSIVPHFMELLNKEKAGRHRDRILSLLQKAILQVSPDSTPQDVRHLSEMVSSTHVSEIVEEDGGELVFSREGVMLDGKPFTSEWLGSELKVPTKPVSEQASDWTKALGF